MFLLAKTNFNTNTAGYQKNFNTKASHIKKKIRNTNTLVPKTNCNMNIMKIKGKIPNVADFVKTINYNINLSTELITKSDLTITITKYPEGNKRDRSKWIKKT